MRDRLTRIILTAVVAVAGLALWPATAHAGSVTVDCDTVEWHAQTDGTLYATVNGVQMPSVGSMPATEGKTYAVVWFGPGKDTAGNPTSDIVAWNLPVYVTAPQDCSEAPPTTPVEATTTTTASTVPPPSVPSTTAPPNESVCDDTPEQCAPSTSAVGTPEGPPPTTGERLPETGVSAAGLVIGVALILIGALAVVVGVRGRERLDPVPEPRSHVKAGRVRPYDQDGER